MTRYVLAYNSNRQKRRVIIDLAYPGGKQVSEDRYQKTEDSNLSYAKPTTPEPGTVLSNTERSDVHPTVFCPLSSDVCLTRRQRLEDNHSLCRRHDISCGVSDF
jgi:hypothetical protein